MSTTLRELATASLRLLGNVQGGQAPAPDDMVVATEALNALIDSWSAEKLKVVAIAPYHFSYIPGKRTYTLGAGGDWDTPRPMNIEDMYVSWNAVIAPGGWSPTPPGYVKGWSTAGILTPTLSNDGNTAVLSTGVQ